MGEGNGCGCWFRLLLLLLLLLLGKGGCMRSLDIQICSRILKSISRDSLMRMSAIIVLSASIFSFPELIPCNVPAKSALLRPRNPVS